MLICHGASLSASSFLAIVCVLVHTSSRSLARLFARQAVYSCQELEHNAEHYLDVSSSSTTSIVTDKDASGLGNFRANGGRGVGGGLGSQAEDYACTEAQGGQACARQVMHTGWQHERANTQSAHTRVVSAQQGHAAQTHSLRMRPSAPTDARSNFTVDGNAPETGSEAGFVVGVVRGVDTGVHVLNAHARGGGGDSSGGLAAEAVEEAVGIQ